MPPVVPAGVQARKLVGEPPVRVQEPRFLALPLSRPSRVLGLRLGVEGVEAVGVVHVGVGVLRLGVDGLVRRGEVGRLEVGVGGMGERRGAGVGGLTHGPQLGQPGRPVAGAVVALLGCGGVKMGRGGKGGRTRGGEGGGEKRKTKDKIKLFLVKSGSQISPAGRSACSEAELRISLPPPPPFQQNPEVLSLLE